jgi:hypothetical protein
MIHPIIVGFLSAKAIKDALDRKVKNLTFIYLGQQPFIQQGVFPSQR